MRVAFRSPSWKGKVALVRVLLTEPRSGDGAEAVRREIDVMPTAAEVLDAVLR